MLPPARQYPLVFSLHQVDNPSSRREEYNLHNGVVKGVIWSSEQVNVASREDSKV